MDKEVKSSAFERFPMMNRLLREQLVGRKVIDLLVGQDCTVIALDNGAMLEVPGFSFELCSPAPVR